MKLLKDILKKIKGFRETSFTITKKTMCAIDILSKHGIEYDSSVFPFGLYPDYGISDAPLTVFNLNENMVEVPLNVVELLRKRIPYSGGGYFSLFPHRVTKYLIKKCNKEGRAVIFYLYRCEFDPEHPRDKLSIFKKNKHYININKTFDRLEKILKDFDFVHIKEIIN